MADISQIISEIEQLPHFRTARCQKCSTEIRVHTLEIYVTCQQCGVQHKCRSLGAAGTEIQDVIDAVLSWSGRGEEFDAVMKRREQILSDG